MTVTTASPESFREAIGAFASGVTVITTAREGVSFGTTASSMTSLCLQPPMVLVCMNRGSATREAVIAVGRFAINVLREGHGDLASRFARQQGDKFAGVRHSKLDGLPLLDDALAHFTCTINRAEDAGTHTVMFARVEKAGAAAGPPLTYFRGRFGRFVEEAAEL